jgi:holo-[acyl-carrier protein] synthase
VIVGTGIDMVDVRRFAGLVERQPTFLDRVLTAQESLLPDGTRRPVHSLAARFAAKEAMAKALGAPAGLEWHHCEVLSDTTGRPRLELTGSVLQAARDLGAFTWHVSMSHDGDAAIASVVLEG